MEMAGDYHLTIYTIKSWEALRVKEIRIQIGLWRCNSPICYGRKLCVEDIDGEIELVHKIEHNGSNVEKC